MGAAGPISPNAWGGFFVQAAMKRDLLCDVRFGSKADVRERSARVRSVP